MLQVKGHGAKFVSPLSKELTHIVGFAFVNDTDLLTFDMSDSEKSWDNLSDCMQEAINRWEGGLKTTGGALVPSKNWVYPIDFKFNSKGKPEYKSLEEIEQTYSVMDKDNNQQCLQRHEAHTDKETLGVFLAPDGNNNAAKLELEKKAKTWRDNIKAGHLTPTLAWHAANTTIMKSLEYPLPALTLTYDECNKIMKIVKQGLLNSLRVSVSIPSASLYGPKSEGRLQLNHLYHTQGLMQIEKLYKFLDTDTVTGKLIRVSLESSIIELGIGRNIFALEYSKKIKTNLLTCYCEPIYAAVKH